MGPKVQKSRNWGRIGSRDNYTALESGGDWTPVTGSHKAKELKRTGDREAGEDHKAEVDREAEA